MIDDRARIDAQQRYTTSFMRRGELRDHVKAAPAVLGGFCLTHVWAHHVKACSVLYSAYAHVRWPTAAAPLPPSGPLARACSGNENTTQLLVRPASTSLGYTSAFPEPARRCPPREAPRRGRDSNSRPLELAPAAAQPHTCTLRCHGATLELDGDGEAAQLACGRRISDALRARSPVHYWRSGSGGGRAAVAHRRGGVREESGGWHALTFGSHGRYEAAARALCVAARAGTPLLDSCVVRTVEDVPAPYLNRTQKGVGFGNGSH